jgi:hypothetical protein
VNRTPTNARKRRLSWVSRKKQSAKQRINPAYRYINQQALFTSVGQKSSHGQRCISTSYPMKYQLAKQYAKQVGKPQLSSSVCTGCLGSRCNVRRDCGATLVVLSKLSRNGGGLHVPLRITSQVCARSKFQQHGDYHAKKPSHRMIFKKCCSRRLTVMIAGRLSKPRGWWST